MSIGPENAEKFEVRTVDRIRHGLKVSFEAYFKSPLYYLFYSLLTATGIGLFLGVTFDEKLYSLLLFLAAANLLQWFYGEWYDKDISGIQKTE